MVVEVKGRERVIERKDGDQLARNRKNYAIEINKQLSEVKGILLCNPWRMLSLEEREKEDDFAPHCITDAKGENIALITTSNLFKAYCAMLNGSSSKEEIIERLFSSVGVTKLL